MSARPIRIQLSRRKGFDLQAVSRTANGLPAVRCSRPSKWGNPFVAHDWQASFRAASLGCRGDRGGRKEAAVKLYRLWLTAEKIEVAEDKLDFWDREVMTVRAKRPMPTIAEIRAELAGKNLACWCKSDEPCHADILLELANG